MRRFKVFEITFSDIEFNSGGIRGEYLSQTRIDLINKFDIVGYSLKRRCNMEQNLLTESVLKEREESSMNCFDSLKRLRMVFRSH